MIDTDTIKKYILDGEWEYQYPQAIEYLLAEVKRLRELLDDYRRFHTWVSEKHYEVIEEWDYMEGVKEEEE